MEQLQQIIQISQTGHKEKARVLFDSFIPSLGDDPLYNCVFAHYMADLQEDPEQELLWDLKSLHYLDRLTDNRLKEFNETLDKSGFYASIYLNIAESSRKTNQFVQARVFIQKAQDCTVFLDKDGYGNMINLGIQKLKQSLGMIVAIVIFCGLPFSLIAEAKAKAQTITNVDDSNPRRITFLLDSADCMISEGKANYSLDNQLAEISQAETVLRKLVFQENAEVWNQFLVRYQLAVAYMNNADISPFQKANLDPEYYAKNQEYFALDGPIFSDIRRHFFEFRRQYLFSPLTLLINFDLETEPGFTDQYSTGPGPKPEALVSYFQIAVDTVDNEMTIFSANGK